MLFVRRAGPGEGTLKTQGVKVIGDLAKAEVRAYGIRMVYVPKGPYFLGSGGVEHGGFFKYTDGTQRIEPYQVTSAGAIATGKQDGKLWVRKQGGQLKDGGEIPASFPNGFAAFYAMKHQITPPQYAAFLNSLPKEQAEKRYAGNENWDNVSTPSDIGVNKDHYSGGQGQVTRRARGRKEPYHVPGSHLASGNGMFRSVLGRRRVVCGLGRIAADDGAWSSRKWCAVFASPSQMKSVVPIGEFRALTPGTGLPLRTMPSPNVPSPSVTKKDSGFKGSHGLGSLTLPADWPQADAVGSGMRCTLYGYGIFDLARPRLSDRLLAAIAEPNRRPSHKWRGVRTAPEGVGP